MLEHELLLKCAKLEADSNEVSGFLSDTLDWDYILKQSQLHDICPLLYNNLKEFSVPIHRTLERIYTHTAFHNMLYLEELRRIEENLKRNGVEMIVLKGPALALSAYGNIALRPFVDMDLLVRKNQLPEIKTLLNTLGYVCQDENFYEKYHFHLPCTRKGKIVFLLELHWEFVDRFILNRVGMKRVWLDGGRKKELPPEINILYLLLHIEKHAFLNKIIYREGNPADWIFTNPRGNKLIWYTDLYEIISGNEIDWENVMKLSREWAIQHIVYYNLSIFNELYPLVQVRDALSRIPDYKISPLKRFFYMPVLSLGKSEAGYSSDAVCLDSERKLSPAFGKRSAFRLIPGMHLRPIRALGLVDYLFPSPSVLMDYYRIVLRQSIRKNVMIVVYYCLHISVALKEILREFIGICRFGISRSKNKVRSCRDIQ